MKNMTEDTRRAVEALKPLCDALRISLDADGSRLYIGGQMIGISCNSTYATIMEAIGYLFWKEYPRFRYSARIDWDLEEDIRRYWIKGGYANE